MQRDGDISAGVLLARPRRAALPGGGLRLAAPAKINLDLYVGPRRANGFHPLDSLVAKVALYDEIVLTPRTDGRIALRCDGADCGPDADNLALRAARLLAGDLPGGQTVGGAEIHLAKAIPPGRGLGGGSSDAAAVLAGLNEVWNLALPPGRLAELGAQLGSDVPLFLGPACSRMTGRGERLAPAIVRPFVALLHVPEAACPTGAVYRAFDALPDAGRPISARPELPLSARPPSRWRDQLRNDLTAPAIAVCPPVGQAMSELSRLLAAPVCLTGSGSAMFVLCDTPAEAGDLFRRLPPHLASRTLLVQRNPW